MQGRGEVGGIGIDWGAHGLVVFGSFAAGVAIIVLLWFGGRLLARGAGRGRATTVVAVLCFLVAAAGLAIVALALSP